MSFLAVDRMRLPDLRTSKIRGTQLAIVVNAKDGEGNPGYRVKLKFPWLNEQESTFWARIAVPMAGSDRGTYVLPETDDQVLVVFEHGDINRPIVVGSLWSRKQEPVEVNQSGKNNTKLIKSRSGHRIIFDDKEGVEKITIVDKTQKNKIVLDSAAKIVKIESDGDIEVIAKANVIMHSNALKIGTSEGVTGKSKSLLVHAQKTFGLKATSGLTIGGGNTTINVSNAAACSVSGSGGGELGGAVTEAPKEPATSSNRGGASSASASSSAGPSPASPPAAKRESLDQAQFEVSGDVFGGDEITMSAVASNLTGSPQFEVHAAADHRVLSTVTGDLVGTRAHCTWRSPQDFTEAAAHDGTRRPESIEVYFVVKLGGKDARSPNVRLHPLRHLNLQLLGTDGTSVEFTVEHDGGTETVQATDRLDAVLRTTTSICWVRFGGHSMKVSFDLPDATEPRGVRCRLAALGYLPGDDDDPFAAELVNAVAQFQANEGLNITGQVDGPTRDALEARHGA